MKQCVLVLRFPAILNALSVWMLVLGLISNTAISAATRTWDGGALTDNFSDAANWDAAILNDDTLVFDGFVRPLPINDILTSVTDLSFASSATAFQIGGNSLLLKGNVFNQSFNIQTISNDLQLNAFSHLFVVPNPNGALVFNGVISDGGNGYGVIVDTGLTVYGEKNTYTGMTQVFTGTIRTDVANAISDSSQLWLASPATYNLNNNNDTIGSLFGDFSSTVFLGSADLTVGFDNLDTQFYGNMSGTGSFTKIGTGKISFGGTNSYSGDTSVIGGVLELLAADTIADTSDIRLFGGTLRLSSSDTVGDLELQANSVIDMGAGNSVFSFKDFTDALLGAHILEIHNWDGVPLLGGGNDQLLVSGVLSLDTAHLSQIRFYSGAGAGYLGSAMVVGTELVPIDPYSAWEVAEAVTVSGRSSDSDGDSHDNEYEYFFGIDPEDPMNGAVNARPPFASIVNDLGSDYAAIEFNYRNDMSMNGYDVYYSYDLDTWQLSSWTRAAVGADWTVLGSDSINGDYTTTKIKWNIPLGAISDRIFFRVMANE